MIATNDSPEPPNLLYMVKQVELASRARLDEIVRPSGITALQYTALTVLARRPHQTQSDLARMSFTKAQSASDLVGALRKRNLITRSPDPHHRRRLLIDLTHEGRALLAKYDPQVKELESVMLADFTPEEAAVLRSFLRRARRALES